MYWLIGNCSHWGAVFIMPMGKRFAEQEQGKVRQRSITGIYSRSPDIFHFDTMGTFRVYATAYLNHMAEEDEQAVWAIRDSGIRRGLPFDS